MSADRLTYCLERISSYRDFERLCTALLAGSDYPGIDPLGGTGDGGRDAIVRSDGNGQKIVFAYTVRGDWRVKLKHDCLRVRELKHNPDVFVFVCTEALNASEKDGAYRMVAQEFGWKLDLFDLERLRALLAGSQRHLVAQHSSIFAPPFFPQSGGESLSESRDTLVIDHIDADHALATWLSRRLTLAGFRTWCRGTAPLAGENPDDSVRQLIELRTKQYLPIASSASVADELFLERCSLAASKESLVLPSQASSGAHARLPSRLRGMLPADFSSSWNDGLQQVLQRMAGIGIQPEFGSEQGKRIALGDYMPTNVTIAKPEPVFANVFTLQLPQTMLIYDLYAAMSSAEREALRKKWAFVEANPYRLLAFTPPPPNSIPATKPERTPEFLWAETPERDGKRSEDVAKELVRRSLWVVCGEKGLEYCADRDLYYFPKRDNNEWNQKIRHVDGRNTRVALTGARTLGWGDRASPFTYQLAPLFQPQHDADGTWSVVVRVYVRPTDLDGKLYELKAIGRRRKSVTKSWWNKDWLARLLGVVQALETSVGEVRYGEGKRAVVMSSEPLRWECPVSLDVQALSGMVDLGEELAEFKAREGDEDDSDESSDPQTEKQSA
ncbi:MAG: hypothetical protein KAX57_03000 [Rhodoferax sp.]|jgi:hypothetical protein|uniref:hypothetical protein n=1 Tax=Rhodoferax sp. TaxID=50421 RepID=UPI001B692958|nr:hypothetical protein [Rhodoferax sp.]MBP8285786.1 hypothetical protein [Rhodoferax sp.]MBP9736758.1 hypothetical protein [Rhodoferax sp.]